MKARLCCLVNPEEYCEGCKLVMCITCTNVHKGATGKCIIDLASSVFNIEFYLQQMADNPGMHEMLEPPMNTDGVESLD